MAKPDIKPVTDGGPAGARGQLADEIVPSRIRSTNPHHQPRDLTAGQRAQFRRIAINARQAKVDAKRGITKPIHDINVPKLNPWELMPQLEANGLTTLSLFSGGGGLDLGFDRAGFNHAASFEILEDAAQTLRNARPDWHVNGGVEGDVTKAKWAAWKGEVAVVHGGPPCQPFSIAGRQAGASDSRDMWPEFIRCIKSVRPQAFVAENVPALASKKFESYVRTQILDPLSPRYHIQMLQLRAEDYGVPQIRRRVIFVGFARKKDAASFQRPTATHRWGAHSDGRAERCLGVREALGLSDIGFDELSPTIRSTLTGPRHTTSILNSVAAQRVFEKIEVWPNGVAPTREAARAYVAKNGHFRLSVPDVAVLQGFPEDWPLFGATYMKLGQLGNAVPPPLAYSLASSVAAALA
ncbi:DNA cytosine methyltransferase [Mycolicibacterium septicum]|uniref:DNA (cytosine-5-)-methyltransferase n=1 Tax=Mycolicibacterium septicum TaxID=98668 RepID=A0ABW9LU77_9MYCO